MTNVIGTMGTIGTNGQNDKYEHASQMQFAPSSTCPLVCLSVCLLVLSRSTRHVCPQCGRKNVFTRYVDTENNNIYISDNVGKCNRLDKCGYHYTPHQYFTDNPWKREKVVALLQDIGKSNKATSNKLPPEPKRVSAGLPRRVLEATMKENCAYDKYGSQ